LRAGVRRVKPGDPFNPHKRFLVVCIPDQIMEADWLQPNDKLVLGRLMRFAGQNGDCRPSHAALAKGCALTVDQVRHSLGRLLGANLISAKFRPGTSSRYVFLWHEVYGTSVPESRPPRENEPQPRDLESRRRDRREPVREQPALPFWERRPLSRECLLCGGTGWKQVNGGGAVERCGHA
jgi:hypothetical protein